MNFIQNDANSVTLIVGQMKVELESLHKILSVCTLIDDKNGPISAREIRQLLKKLLCEPLHHVKRLSRLTLEHLMSAAER